MLATLDALSGPPGYPRRALARRLR
jgi:hypothetical protein